MKTKNYNVYGDTYKATCRDCSDLKAIENTSVETKNRTVDFEKTIDASKKVFVNDGKCANNFKK